jgi:hypothetical protein
VSLAVKKNINYMYFVVRSKTLFAMISKFFNFIKISDQPINNNYNGKEKGKGRRCKRGRFDIEK